MDYISPIGALRIQTSERGLRSIKYISPEEQAFAVPDAPQNENDKNCITLCVSALNSYFAKQWGAFDQLRSKIPLDLEGSDFHKKVWGIIYSLPNTYPIASLNYSELAYLAGKPEAARTCAKICSQNNIPILIPCHRIIAVNGKVSGYMGGTMRKSWLLWHEGIKTRTKTTSTKSLLQQPPQTR